MLSVHLLAISGELKRFLEHSKKPLHVVGLSIVTHEPDTPDLAGRSAESAGNLDAVLAHQVARHRLPIHVGRNKNASYRREAQFRVLNQIGKEQDLKRGGISGG